MATSWETELSFKIVGGSLSYTVKFLIPNCEDVPFDMLLGDKDISKYKFLELKDGRCLVFAHDKQTEKEIQEEADSEAKNDEEAKKREEMVRKRKKKEKDSKKKGKDNKERDEKG